MDRALLERMVGAIALVLLLVVVAPALLDGSSESGFDKFAHDSDDKEVSTQVIVLNEPRRTESSEDAASDMGVETPKIIALTRPAPAAKPAVSAPSPVSGSIASAPPKDAAPPKAAANYAAAPPPPASDPAPVVLAEKPAVSAPQPVAVAGKPRAVPDKPDAASLKADKGIVAEGFAVQLGSFGQVENAQKYAAQLGARGFAVFVRSGGSAAAVHRVYAGPRPSRDAAEKLAVVLADAGYKGIVVDLSGDSGNGGR